MAKAKQTKEAAGTIRVRLYKSMNSCQWKHRLSVKALAVSCDVRDEASVQAAIADVLGEFGKLDLLIKSRKTLFHLTDQPL